LTIKDGRTVVAIEEGQYTQVIALTDFDVLQLDAADAHARRAAILSIASRRYSGGVEALIQRLEDSEADIQDAAVDALSEIRDASALPALIRAVNNHPDETRFQNLLSAIQRFELTDIIAALLACSNRPAVSYRRGVAKILEHIPTIEAFDMLTTLMSDHDPAVRAMTARALGRRNDPRGCLSLVGSLDDPDEKVRLAVQQAIASILQSNGLLTSAVVQLMTAPLDVDGFAREVIAVGRMSGFADFGAPPAGEFLERLMAACARSGSEAQFLNAVEGLTSVAPAGFNAESERVALALLVIGANHLCSAARWLAAIGIYHQAAALADRIEAPAIEWRAWSAAGACHEELGDQQSAWKCYQRALAVVDRLWFALLEEEKLQHFFQDKAGLYDRALLSALRLGHATLALEWLEKGKTRYLGDLIARHRPERPLALESETKEEWKNSGRVNAMRVPVGTSPRQTEEIEIVGVGFGEAPVTGAVIKPKQLAALEERSAMIGAERVELLSIVKRIWNIVGSTLNHDNEINRDRLDEMYEVVRDLRDLLRAEAGSRWSKAFSASSIASSSNSLSDRNCGSNSMEIQWGRSEESAGTKLLTMLVALAIQPVNRVRESIQ
jgi:tetratricopeptide (TPR) repeat protein